MAYHVEKIGDRWKVTNDMFFSAVSTHFLKSAAVDKAEKLGDKNNEEVVVHYETGGVQKVI